VVSDVCCTVSMVNYVHVVSARARRYGRRNIYCESSAEKSRENKRNLALWSGWVMFTGYIDRVVTVSTVAVFHRQLCCCCDRLFSVLIVYFHICSVVNSDAAYCLMLTANSVCMPASNSWCVFIVCFVFIACDITVFVSKVTVLCLVYVILTHAAALVICYTGPTTAWRCYRAFKGTHLVSWQSVVKGDWTRVVLFCCVFASFAFS